MAVGGTIKFELILLLLFLVITSVKSITCNDGYYDNGGTCASCNSSCLTCSDATSCLTCSDMFLNSTTKLCQRCPSGQYFDTPRQTCQSCGSSCIDKCAYQSFCFQCGSSQYFDLSAMKCVTACNSTTQISFNDTQFQNIPVCRGTNYYVNPNSTQIVELGTKQYPYK